MIEILKVILYLMIFIIILWGAYYFSKRISVYSLKFTQSRYMSLVDKLTIGKETGLAIIKIGNKHMLVSLANNKIEMLKELSEDELIELEPVKNLQTDPYAPFKCIVDKTCKKIFCYSKRLIEKVKGTLKKMTLKDRDQSNHNSFSDMFHMKKKVFVEEATSDTAVDELLYQVSIKTNTFKNKMGKSEGVVKNKS